MFYKKSHVNEIEEAMKSNLSHSAKESLQQTSKLQKAADLVNVAAEIFEDLGLTSEADVLIAFLEKLASDDSKFVKNLKETGTMFDKEDFMNSEDDGLDFDEKDVDELAGKLDFEETD